MSHRDLDALIGRVIVDKEFRDLLTCTVYRASGGLRLRDLARWRADDHKSTVEFGDDEAVGLATRMLERLQLVPAAAESRFAKFVRLNVGSVDRATRRSIQRVLHVGVVFHRVVDDLPVAGPGGVLVIWLDQEGELAAVDRLWREVAGIHRPVERLRAPQFAENRLRRIATTRDEGRIEVREERLAYFEAD